MGAKYGENLALTTVFLFFSGAVAPSHLTIDPPVLRTQASGDIVNKYCASSVVCDLAYLSQ